MNRNPDDFLERIRARGELAKAAIVEAVTESAQRVERRQQDLPRAVIDEALGSLRLLQHEVGLAIQRVEALMEEFDHYDRPQDEVILVARPPETRRGESVRLGRGPGAELPTRDVPGS